MFLHAVKDGPASRSYGLQVAQLAGVPREVIGQARHYLEALESQRDRADGSRRPRESRAKGVAAIRRPAARAAQRRPARPMRVRTALEALDPDELSPESGSGCALQAAKTARKA